MKLILKNGKPAFVQENGEIIFHSMYTGNRFLGNMHNILKDYSQQKWTVRETGPFECSKNISALVGNIRYFRAECENSTIIAALSDKTALFRTETVNADSIKNSTDVIALGGSYVNRLEKVMFNTMSEHNGLRLYDMCSSTRVRSLLENDFAESAVHMPAIDRTGQALQFGFVSFERYFSSIYANEDGTVEYRLMPDSPAIMPGQTLVSDWMVLTLSDDSISGITEFARFIHDFNAFTDRHIQTPEGFCSWYYYMGNINERMVYENLAKCDNIRDRVPLKIFQIDDGWFTGSQVWEANESRFPKGMKFYADLIREHGYTPGIWLTPFNFWKDTDTVKNHPDWFVHTKSGEFAEKDGCCMLDATHPEVQEHIRKLYRKLTFDWGFRYLKIDIVSVYMTVGIYHDPNASALQNLREYFRLIRESVHPDTYIIGCTCPMFEVAEFVDGMRVSGDIFERWESLIEVFNVIFKRFFMNRTLYISDPDCLMLRKAENEDDDCRRYCTRTDEEIHTFQVAMYAAGGALFISDKLTLMNDRQIDMYSKMFPVGERVGTPKDLWNSYIPGTIECGTADGVRRVALINWSERPRSFCVGLSGACSAVEHFTEEDLGIHSGEYRVTLNPHCSQLVCFKPISE